MKPQQFYYLTFETEIFTLTNFFQISCLDCIKINENLTDDHLPHYQPQLSYEIIS